MSGRLTRPKTTLRLSKADTQDCSDYSAVSGARADMGGKGEQGMYLSLVDAVNSWMEEHRMNQMNELEQSLEQLQKKILRDLRNTSVNGDLAKRTPVKLPKMPHPSTAKSVEVVV